MNFAWLAKILELFNMYIKPIVICMCALFGTISVNSLTFEEVSVSQMSILAKYNEHKIASSAEDFYLKMYLRSEEFCLVFPQHMSVLYRSE
jgi:hypothetical protein